MGSRGISDFEESGETVNWNVLRSAFLLGDAPPLAIDGSRVAPGREQIGIQDKEIEKLGTLCSVAGRVHQAPQT